MSRPRKYDDPEELQLVIDKYFEDIKTPTISGLSLYCGFADRHSFYAYEKHEKFSHTIKRARARITEMYEKNMVGNNAAGSIFMLKNLGYSDKSEIDLNANVVKMDKIIKDGKEVTFDVGTTETTGSTSETAEDS
jgi:hypothetical protein